VRWTTALGAADATLLPPALTRDHVVVGAFVEDPKGPTYTYSAWLLDKSGRVVQNTKSSSGFERPPSFLGVAHDRLIISVSSRVEVQR